MTNLASEPKIINDCAGKDPASAAIASRSLLVALIACVMTAAIVLHCVSLVLALGFQPKAAGQISIIIGLLGLGLGLLIAFHVRYVRSLSLTWPSRGGPVLNPFLLGTLGGVLLFLVVVLSLWLGRPHPRGDAARRIEHSPGNTGSGTSLTQHAPGHVGFERLPGPLASTGKSR